MIKESVKFQDSTILEGMTSIRGLLAGIRDAGNTRRILRICVCEDSAVKLQKEIRFFTQLSKTMQFTVDTESASFFDQYTVGNTHGGVIAFCTDRPLPRLCDCYSTFPERGFLAMIQGIEDPYNFGYAIRSLYACGCDGLILSDRNWFSAAGVVARSSAGASERIRACLAEPTEAAELMHRLGYRVVCADVRTDLLLPDADLHKPILLIVGGERRGISRALLSCADLTVRIPYGQDFPAALSSASAATIMGYEVLRQNR